MSTRVWRAVRAVLAGLVVTAALAPTPARAAAAPAPARIETFDVATRLVDPSSPGGILQKRRTSPRVHVLLPEGYDDHPGERYPVLWLLHGANGGTDSWLSSIKKLAAGLPAVIVMPDGGQFGMYMDWWNGGTRGGPAWATFHLQVLRQKIEERYRIRPERRWHAIAGISMGGQGALRYAALLPGYFGSVAGFSAALPNMRTPEAEVGLGVLTSAGGAVGVTYDAVYGPPTAPYARGTNPQDLVTNYEHSRIFLTSGLGAHCPQDPIPQTLAIDTITETFIHLQQGPFAAAARNAGADVTPQTTCGSHTFGVWDRAFAAARAWGFFEPVPEAPHRWTYRTIATTGEAWGLRFRFAQPPSNVVVLRRAGDALRVSGHGRLELRGPEGCHVELDLPYDGRLPAACSSPV